MWCPNAITNYGENDGNTPAVAMLIFDTSVDLDACFCKSGLLLCSLSFRMVGIAQHINYSAND